jgi:ankyrin repeat protein
VTSFTLPCQWSTYSMSELVAQLMDMPRLQSAQYGGEESLLQLIAQLGTAEQLEALLDRCPHLVAMMPCFTNPPALHCSARSGNVKCALVLLQHGCDPNMKDVLNGRTIAHFACERGDHQYLEAIINAGYDVDLSVTSSLFGTPAHAAVRHPSTVQFLIDRGANVDDATFRKGTPATRAASVGAAESLRILLAAGAYVNGTQTSVPLALAACEHPACLDVLGDAGADLDVVDCAGETAAHRAASEGQLESLRTLHKHGANMFAVSRAWQTPEQLAARDRFAKCVKFLAELRISTPPEHQNSSQR